MGRTLEAAKDYENALYAYEAAGDYRDASVRLENLQSQIYTKATQLMDEGDYENALTLFTMLGEYFNAPVHARECKRIFREQKYAEAETLLASGDYRGAYEAFKAIGGYSDAEFRAEELRVSYHLDEAPAEENEGETDTESLPEE